MTTVFSLLLPRGQAAWAEAIYYRLVWPVGSSPASLDGEFM
jgi:hypothetical protein